MEVEGTKLTREAGVPGKCCWPRRYGSEFGENHLSGFSPAVLFSPEGRKLSMEEFFLKVWMERQLKNAERKTQSSGVIQDSRQ